MNTDNEPKRYHIIWRQKHTGTIYTEKFVKSARFGKVLDCATEAKFHLDVIAEIWELKDEANVKAKLQRQELKEIWDSI